MILIRASQWIIAGSILNILMYFPMPLVSNPELFQDDYGLLEAIKESDIYVAAHLLQMLGVCMMLFGCSVFSMVTLGVLPVNGRRMEASAEHAISAVLTLGVGVIGAFVFITFETINSMALSELARRWIEEGPMNIMGELSETEAIQLSAETMAIVNSLYTMTMILTTGLFPFLSARVITRLLPGTRLWSRMLQGTSLATCICGVWYGTVFFTPSVRLNEETSGDLIPYLDVSNLLLLVCGITFLVIPVFAFHVLRQVKGNHFAD